jgi:protein arginine kinase activator
MKGMECSFCKGSEATCHLTKVVNGKAVEVHVCEQCIPEVNQTDLVDFDIWEAVSKLAAAKGLPDPAKMLEPVEDEEISAKSLLMPTGHPAQACTSCGFTGEDLRKTGRLGCPNCYAVFSEMLADVINDCQKGHQHLGKVPKSQKSVRQKSLRDLLQKAVDTERFEDAASLRDQLKVLEEEV